MIRSRTLIASFLTLCILMIVAHQLGKSLEGFIPPLIVWLLLAANSMRKDTTTPSC